MSQTHGYAYHTYPVYSSETGIEGEFKRFSAFPTPKDVYDEALLGLPKFFPLTREPITIELAEKYLMSAVTQIESDLDCDLSETIHYHAEDLIDGMFSNNFTGIVLQRFPATQIVQMQYKYPHTNTAAPFQTYTIPSQWIYLKKNKINIIASIGTITVQADNSGLVTSGGIFNQLTGFGNWGYRPGVIEVVYKAGFDHDKMPAYVADLIKVWAAKYMLEDLAPVLFPQGGVNVAIDGVSQGVSFTVPQLLQTRLQQLDAKRKEMAATFKKSFGQTIKVTRFGS